MKIPKRSESEILGDYIKALAEDPVLALKWAFYVGDIREGLITATWKEILAFLHQMIFEI